MVRLQYIIPAIFLISNLCESQLAKSINNLPSECGAITLDDRITNGIDATLKQFPFMVLLGYSRYVFQLNLFQFVCGGTIITEEYVLTAAHCFKTTLTFARLGELDIRNETDCVPVAEFVECGDPVIDIPIKKELIHSNYNPNNFKNDIALVRLSRKIRFTEFIQPICLPFNIDIPLGKSPLTVTGWGTTSSSTTVSSPILQYAQMEVWQNKKCENVLAPDVRPLKETQICGNGKNGQDACRGDSGGPMIAVKVFDFQPRYFQVGIVSFGATSGCGNRELPSVYTRVDKYMNWITENI